MGTEAKLAEEMNRLAVPGRFLAGAWLLVVIVLWGWRGWILYYKPSVYQQLHPEFPWEQLRAFGAWALLTCCSVGWGQLIGCRLRLLPKGLWAALGVRLLLGHVAAGLLIFAIGIAGLYPWGLLILLGGLAGLPGAVRPLRGTMRRPGLGALLFLAVGAAGVGASFLLAFAPVTESDGIRYQLVIPQEFLKAGGIVKLPYQAFTNLPAQTNLLYLAGMSAADARVAQVIHWTYLPMVMLFSGLLGQRLFRSLQIRMSVQTDSRIDCGIEAGVVAGTSPAMLVMGGWPFVDLSTAAFSLAAMWALCPGSLRRLDARLVLAGIFGGAAIATKLTALITIGLIGCIALGIIAARAAKIRRLLLFLVPIILVSGPWFAKNIVFHHNPVYPAAFGIFGSDEWTEEADQFYKDRAGSKGLGKSLWHLARSPYDATTQWIRFESHNPGPGLLGLLPIAAVGIGFAFVRRRRSVIMALFVSQIVLGWIAWFYTYQSVRFLLVQIALISAGGTAVLGVLTSGHKAMRVLLLPIALCGVGWYLFYATIYKETRPVIPALGLVGEEEYLSANLNFYDAVQWLNGEVEPGGKVFYIGEHRALYAQFEVVHSDWFDVPRILVDIRNSADNAAMLRGWETENIRWVLWNYAELSLYEEMFAARFNQQEWVRFKELEAGLLREKHLAFSPRPNVFVIDMSSVYSGN